MSTLYITIGLPGSGKTARAKAFVAEYPVGRFRVNRDDLGGMGHGGRVYDADDMSRRPREDAISVAQYAAVRALLDDGIDVVVDDTNLHPAIVEKLRASAAARHAVVVWDMTDVPVDVCVARDAARGARGERHTGEAAIRNMYDRFLKPDTEECPVPVEADRKNG